MIDARNDTSFRITPRRFLFPGFSSMIVLYSSRRMLWHFVKREVAKSYRGTFFGGAWWLVHPLMLFLIYLLVFGRIFAGRFGVLPEETFVDYAVGVFVGLTMVNLVLDVLSPACAAIQSQPNLVKKVVFPLEILPATVVGIALFRCMVSLAIALSFTVFASNVPGWKVVFVLPIIMSLAGIALGTSFALSAIGVFIRDLGPITQFASVILVLLSAVFFPISKIPADLSWLKWNPVLIAVEGARGAILWDSVPNLSGLVVLCVSGIFISILGASVFFWLKRSFADVL